MNEAASRMSSRSFGVLGFINRFPGFVDGLDEIRVSEGAGGHEVNVAPEKRFEVVQKAKILIGGIHVRSAIEFNKKVDVTRATEIACCGGAEDVEPSDMIAPADIVQSAAFSFSQNGQGVLLWSRKLPYMTNYTTHR